GPPVKGAPQGTGQMAVDPAATILFKTGGIGGAPQHHPSGCPIIMNWKDVTQGGERGNLAAHAMFGTNTCTVASIPATLTVGSIVLIDQITNNHPDVFWGLNHDPPGGGSRRWCCRQDRSLTQLMEVTAITGNTVTFATNFHCTFY